VQLWEGLRHAEIRRSGCWSDPDGRKTCRASRMWRNTLSEDAAPMVLTASPSRFSWAFCTVVPSGPKSSRNKQGKRSGLPASIARRIKPQMVRCLELVTATFAGPGMTDMAFAHVFRPVWCNQSVIAPDARNSIRRIIVGQNDHHDRPPCILFCFFLAWKDKSIMTVVLSNFSIWCVAVSPCCIAVPLGFP
jgi:hypothetical protein